MGLTRIRPLALLALAAALTAPVAESAHARPAEAGAAAACTRYDAGTLAKAQRVANAARASVVVVETDGGRGTGFAVSADGILTNHHVVDGASTISVRVLDGRRLPAELVRTAGFQPDAALIRVAGGHGLRPLQIGRVAGLRRSQAVVAVGHPAIGGEWSATVGRISTVSYWGFETNRYREVESNVPGGKGQSGSPLLDLSGKVVGVIHGPKRGVVGVAPKPGTTTIQTRLLPQTMMLAAAIGDALKAVGLLQLVPPSERTVPPLPQRPPPPDMPANCVPAARGDFDRATLARAQAVANRARASVVAISRDGAPNGTGWVIAPGIVVTNDHVVEGGSSLGVWLLDGRHLPAELIGGARPPDIAFLRVPLPANVQPLPLGASPSLRPGDPLVAVGQPADAGAGWFASIGRFRAMEEGGALLASTVAGGEGSSGSPILSLDGTVVGVIHSGRPAELPAGPVSRVRTSLVDTSTALGAPIEDALAFGRAIGALP
ncbi:MAG TPA: serine protease [Gaiellaceae bacterium]|nr:serine protease [Gaiellaceae bacterium]